MSDRANLAATEVVPQTPHTTQGRNLQGLESWPTRRLQGGRRRFDNGRRCPLFPSNHTSLQQEGNYLAKPRIRSIKPEMWQDRDFMALPLLGKLAFLCLIQHADDEGRLDSDAQHLSDAWLHTASDEVQPMLDALQERDMIAQYRVKNRHYISLTGWAEHQKVDHPRPSNCPPPPTKRNTKSSRALANVRGEPESPLANDSEKPLTDPDPDPDPERSPIPSTDSPQEKPTEEEGRVLVEIGKLGISLRLRERVTQALETASRKGANNRVAFLLGTPEAGRTSLLGDLAIGWREQDRLEEKRKEARGSSFLGAGLLKRIS